jgi:hypothetical protein
MGKGKEKRPEEEEKSAAERRPKACGPSAYLMKSGIGPAEL